MIKIIQVVCFYWLALCGSMMAGDTLTVKLNCYSNWVAYFTCAETGIAQELYEKFHTAREEFNAQKSCFSLASSPYFGPMLTNDTCHNAEVSHYSNSNGVYGHQLHAYKRTRGVVNISSNYEAKIVLVEKGLIKYLDCMDKKIVLQISGKSAKQLFKLFGRSEGLNKKAIKNADIFKSKSITCSRNFDENSYTCEFAVDIVQE